MKSNISKFSKQTGDMPNFIIPGLQYETLMGSYAYGVSHELSDRDYYGFCVPPAEVVFPHINGEIIEFDTQPIRFEQYQKDFSENDVDYQFTIYSIVKYFRLCMENNPNMIDSLYTPDNCVSFQTKVGSIVRDSRNQFLHKGAYHKFKGYSYSQLHKINNEKPVGKRKIIVDKFGWDTKFGYHLVRLVDECEQILRFGTIDLQRNREQLKDIRNGNWKKEEVREYFQRKEKELERLYETSALPYGPDEKKIKNLLLSCLEIIYGNLNNLIKIKENPHRQLVEDIKELIKSRGL